jgi:hypothetical protein
MMEKAGDSLARPLPCRPTESDVIIGAPFFIHVAIVVISQELLGSLIWLLMRLLEHPRGFRSEPTLMEWLASNLAILWPCRPTENVLSLVLLMMAIMDCSVENARAFDLPQ